MFVCFSVHCYQVEEFAHINGWEAYPDEEPSTEKPSSKTSSRVSTPIAEVDSKKAEQEPAKVETKETTTEKKEEVEDKVEPMKVEKDEGGIVNNSCNLSLVIVVPCDDMQLLCSKAN